MAICYRPEMSWVSFQTGFVWKCCSASKIKMVDHHLLLPSLTYVYDFLGYSPFFLITPHPKSTPGQVGDGVVLCLPSLAAASGLQRCEFCWCEAQVRCGPLAAWFGCVVLGNARLTVGIWVHLIADHWSSHNHHNNIMSYYIKSGYFMDDINQWHLLPSRYSVARCFAAQLFHAVPLGPLKTWPRFHVEVLHSGQCPGWIHTRVSIFDSCYYKLLPILILVAIIVNIVRSQTWVVLV